jgi:hypothetical protein
MTYDCLVNADGFTRMEQEKFFNDRHQFYQRLVVCEGAKCMLTANINVEEGWCNGTLGTVVSMTDKEIVMKSENGKTCQIPRRLYTRVKHRTECDVVLGKDEKKKKGQRYCGRRDCNHTPIYNYVDNDFDSKEEGGTMMEVQQFPILLAWGITIHKSQGMTLDAVEIDIGSKIFAAGQAYTALSRAQSLASVKVKNISMSSFIINADVLEFYKNVEKEVKIKNNKFIVKQLNKLIHNILTNNDIDKSLDFIWDFIPEDDEELLTFFNEYLIDSIITASEDDRETYENYTSKNININNLIQNVYKIKKYLITDIELVRQKLREYNLE